MEETEIAVDVKSFSTEVLASLARDPDATTYQFVFIAGRQDDGPDLPSPGMLSERLLSENEVLRTRLRELERDYTAQSSATAELVEARRERDELREEVIRRTQEAHQLHRDLKYTKADLAVKDAFVADLRQQLLAMRPVAVERDRLLAKRKQVSARRDEWMDERRQLLARQTDLKNEVRALRVYTNSAGFRLVEGVISRLRSFPMIFTTARSIARKIAGRTDVHG